MQKIAIEENLTPIKNFLLDKGFDVESISLNQKYTDQVKNYDALVIAGTNRNFLGVSDTNTKALVIDAEGMTPEQVYNELRSRL